MNFRYLSIPAMAVVGTFIGLNLAPGSASPTTLEAAKQAVVQDKSSVTSLESSLVSAKSAQASAEKVVASIQAETPTETQAEKEAREKAEREAREKAEREAKEKAEKEAAEKGSILWTGDASKPLYEEWASISDQEHCSQTTSSSNVPDSRITLVNDARFARGNALRFHMNQGDSGCFSGRSELAGGGKFGTTFPNIITPGHEGWFAFQVLYPTDYPLNSATIADGGTMQFHGYGGPGTVPFGISAGRTCDGSEGPGTPHEGGPELGYLKAWLRGSVSCLSRSIKANTVYNFVIHARFTEDSSGFAEVFLNGTKVFNFTGAFGFNAGTPESIPRAGLYLDTSRTESPAVDLLEAGWNVATTRASAEAHAF